MHDIAKGVVGSLIASALIALGLYLSYELVPERTTLNYKVAQQKTSELSSWFLTLRNNSSIPIDVVKLTAPRANLLAVSYSVPSPIPLDEYSWEGSIAKGAEIKALYLFSSGVVFNESVLQDLVAATYQERNDITGEWELRSVEFDFGDSSWRFFWKTLWFLLPLIVVSVIYFLGLFLYRKYRARET
jgi:hypothetical protein